MQFSVCTVSGDLDASVSILLVVGNVKRAVKRNRSRGFINGGKEHKGKDVTLNFWKTHVRHQTSALVRHGILKLILVTSLFRKDVKVLEKVRKYLPG